MGKTKKVCQWKEHGCSRIECEHNGVSADDCIVNGFLDKDLTKVMEEVDLEAIRRIYALSREPRIPGTQSKS